MTEINQKMIIPFGPFETNTSSDAVPIPPKLNTPVLTLETGAACSDLTSPKETTAPIPVNMNEIRPADPPLERPPGQEPALDPQQELRSPHSQASSPTLLRPSRRRQRRLPDQAQMQASLDAPSLVVGSEESLTGTETRYRPLDLHPTAQDSPRYQPYRVPGTRTGSGSLRPARVGSTSAPDREAVHRTDSSRMPTDPGQRHPWDQEDPQTIMSVLDTAWVSGGKTTVPSVTHPSRSMHPLSVRLEVASEDSRPSMKEMGRMVPVNLDPSREDSASWSSLGLTMGDRAVLSPPLDLQGLGEFYLPQSGTYTQRAVDREPVAPDSLSVELQDSPLEIETTAHQGRALSYSQELRMQQEEQLRRVKERIQEHQYTTAQTPQSLHHLDLPQHRPQSLPMLSGPQLLDHSGHPAHLARPSSRIDMGMARMVPGMDSMALATGDMGMEAPQGMLDNMRGMVAVPSGLPAQTLPARDHQYLQEAPRLQVPSRQRMHIPGDEREVPIGLGANMEMGMANALYAPTNNYSLESASTSMGGMELGFDHPRGNGYGNFP
jgi:hypothetical protein